MRHLYRVTSAAWDGTPRFVLAESATEAEEATRAPAPSYTRLAELPGDAEEIGAEMEAGDARTAALTAALERAQQALRSILDATGCSYQPSPDEWPRAAVEEVRRVVGGFGGAS